MRSLDQKQQPTPLFWPGEFRGQRSLAGYSPRGHKELEAAEHAHSQIREVRQVDLSAGCTLRSF